MSCVCADCVCVCAVCTVRTWVPRRNLGVLGNVMFVLIVYVCVQCAQCAPGSLGETWLYLGMSCVC